MVRSGVISGIEAFTAAREGASEADQAAAWQFSYGKWRSCHWNNAGHLPTLFRISRCMESGALGMEPNRNLIR
jgi:hypothetical protein